jgi:hypothetical protein
MDANEVEEFFGSLPRVVRELKRGKRVNRFLAGFTLFAFLLVSWRTEVQSAQIEDAVERDRLSAFRTCQLVNDNARALNEFVDVAIASVKANEALTKADKEYRVSLYVSIKQRLPVCARP